MLYPIGKNLIPDFNDPGWFSDGNPSVAINSNNPHSMNLTLTTSANGRLIWIPVELGKTYTFSFKNITGLYRFYKRRVYTHDTNMALAQSASPGMPITYTFTVDDTYQGFITIRLTQGITGTFLFENMQLEEGSVATAFEPTKLGNKKAIKPSETINSDMTGAGLHVYPYGNIISVKEDVRLWGYKIQTGTPIGTYDSVIYEWNNGAIGQPLFREIVDATTQGVKDLSFKGTLLKAGKKYYIGRNDPNRDNSSTGNAGVYRKTGMPGTDFKYITTLGGSQFYSPAIDFPSTWYYVFGLEVTLANVKPSLVPKKNLMPKGNLVLGSWQGVPSTINTGSNLYYALPYSIPLKAGTYTISSRGDVNAAVVNASSVFLSSTASLPQQFTIPTDMNVYIHFRKKDNTPWDTLTSNIEELKIQIELGSVATPYEPNKGVNPTPVALQPKKNLLPKMSDWTYTNATGKISFPSDYKLQMNGDTPGLYYNQHTFVEKGKVYTASVGYLTSNARVAIREVKANGSKVFMTNLVPGTQSLTWTPASDTVKIEVDCTTNGSGIMIFENVQLEVGSIATPFEKFVLTNKPAIRYPKKNLIDFKPANIEQGGIDGTGTWVNSNQRIRYKMFIPVKPNTDYTISLEGLDLSLWYWAFVEFNKEALSGAQVYNSGWTTTYSKSKKTESTTKYIGVLFSQRSNPDVTPSMLPYPVMKMQLEEGTTQTPFESYKLTNQKL
jgi:hypothetical protein